MLPFSLLCVCLVCVCIRYTSNYYPFELGLFIFQPSIESHWCYRFLVWLFFFDSTTMTTTKKTTMMTTNNVKNKWMGFKWQNQIRTMYTSDSLGRMMYVSVCILFYSLALLLFISPNDNIKLNHTLTHSHIHTDKKGYLICHSFHDQKVLQICSSLEQCSHAVFCLYLFFEIVVFIVDD